MPRVVHFEIEAENPERAAKFYTKVFGWKIEKWDGPMDYWMVVTGDKKEPGINGGMYKRKEKAKGNDHNAYVCTIDVPSVDEYEKKIKANGGKITMPKSAIPGVGWFATATDTEGNCFSIMKTDMKAK